MAMISGTRACAFDVFMSIKRCRHRDSCPKMLIFAAENEIDENIRHNFASVSGASPSGDGYARAGTALDACGAHGQQEAAGDSAVVFVEVAVAPRSEGAVADGYALRELFAAVGAVDGKRCMGYDGQPRRRGHEYDLP